MIKKRKFGTYNMIILQHCCLSYEASPDSGSTEFIIHCRPIDLRYSVDYIWRNKKRRLGIPNNNDNALYIVEMHIM